MNTYQEYTKIFPEYAPYLNHSAEECANAMVKVQEGKVLNEFLKVLSASKEFSKDEKLQKLSEACVATLNGAKSQAPSLQKVVVLFPKTVVPENQDVSMQTIVTQKLGVNERVLDMMKASREKNQEEAVAFKEKVQKLQASYPNNPEIQKLVEETEKDLSRLEAERAHNLAFEEVLRDLYKASQSSKQATLDDMIKNLDETLSRLQKVLLNS
jgi:hypothetical protein